MSTFRDLTLVLVLVSGFDCLGQADAGAAPGQPQSPESPVPSRGGSAGFAGVVRDASGQPAPGVALRFIPGFQGHEDSPQPFEIQSDRNGRYLIPPRRAPTERSWADCPTNIIVARDLARNLAVRSEFTEAPSNLDLTLLPGITLTGRLKDKEGAPVTNATVEVGMVERMDLGFVVHPRTEKLGPPEYDGRGSFTFRALPQGGVYRVTVSAKGYGVANVQVSAEESRTNHYEFAPFVLKRPDRRLAGRVVMPNGAPAAGARVWFSGEGQTQLTEVKSDNEGRFVLEPVCEGPVTVHAQHGHGTEPIPVGSSEKPGSGWREGRTSCQGGDANIVVRLGLAAP